MHIKRLDDPLLVNTKKHANKYAFKKQKQKILKTKLYVQSSYKLFKPSSAIQIPCHTHLALEINYKKPTHQYFGYFYSPII